MATRVIIDPNRRVRGNQTVSDLEKHVVGPLTPGQSVVVIEPESSTQGLAEVTDIDVRNRLVFLRVDWKSLQPALQDFQPEPIRTGFTALPGLGRPFAASAALAVSSAPPLADRYGIAARTQLNQA